MNTNTTTETRKDFETVKRTFEKSLANGGDYAAPLYDLATAVAYSVINKCIDPQRKTAAQLDSASNSGQSPLMIELKQGIGKDRRTLDSTQRNANAATRTTYNADGDYITETADKDAAAAILEQAAEHANGENWLDVPFTVRRLSKRVYIRKEDSAAYREEQTTPIQEVYKTVRRTIQNSRAMRTDPRNGYSYIEDVAPDGLETIYLRLGKYADLGGFNCDGNYTTDKQTVEDYGALVAKLDLTDRQAQILKLRLQGKGYKAIATYLGVTQKAIAKTVAQIQTKATAAGIHA